MEHWMSNKRQILCQIFIKVWREKTCEYFAASSWIQQVPLQNCLASVWIIYFSPEVETALFSIHCIESHNQERIFYNVKYLQWLPEPSLQSKTCIFSYSVSHRILMHLNVRTEVSALWQIEKYKCHHTRNIWSF